MAVVEVNGYEIGLGADLNIEWLDGFDPEAAGVIFD